MLPMRKHEKNRKILEAASLLPKMRPGLFLVIGIMLLESDIYSLLPLYNTMAILVPTSSSSCPTPQSTSSPPDA